jgi:NADH-quinone oxidoreductase subunit M
MNLLNLVIALPMVGFLVLLLFPRENHGAIRTACLAFSLIVFVASLGLLAPFLTSGPGTYFKTDIPWITYPPIRYHVELDGISLWLVILSTLLTPIVVLVSWSSIGKRVKEFYALLLLLEFGLVGVFVAYDLFLFYVFWEVSLVPMYFLIGIWGHDHRIYAAVKFFLYTMTGSVLMLAAIIYVYNSANTFDYTQILTMMSNGQLNFGRLEQMLLFLAFFFAFAIKVPLFPLHTWLPDAHGEAPTAGSVMLASVMLKMGTYGLLRFCIPMFPESSRACAPWIVGLAVIGIIYGALVALVQPNMKRLVAYSSVSHLGFVVMGLFSFNQLGLDGAVYQMLNNGISTGALFMLVGYLYERRHSLEIKDYGGVATPAPQLSTVFLITTLASIGLPMLNNFVGEYLVLQAAALVYFPWAVAAAIGVILSAAYMLWLYQRTFFGKASEELTHHMPDMNLREWAAMLPLLILMLWMGTRTQTFLPVISAQNALILKQADARKEIQVQARPVVPAAAMADGTKAIVARPALVPVPESSNGE